MRESHEASSEAPNRGTPPAGCCLVSRRCSSRGTGAWYRPLFQCMPNKVEDFRRLKRLLQYREGSGCLRAGSARYAGNVARLHTKPMAQGANIPCTPEAEAALAERGVLVLPDFIANAGGVICAAVEYQGGSEGAAFSAIDEKIRTNTAAVLDGVRLRGALPRAALALAKTRLERAMATRRWDH
jgi:hypothetical protein